MKRRSLAACSIVAVGWLLGALAARNEQVDQVEVAAAPDRIAATAHRAVVKSPPVAGGMVTTVADWDKVSTLDSSADLLVAPPAAQSPMLSPSRLDAGPSRRLPVIISPPLSRPEARPAPARPAPVAPPLAREPVAPNENSAPTQDRSPWAGWASMPASARAMPVHASPAATASTSAAAATNAGAAAATPGEDPHAACFEETLYPSAKKCAECHQQIFEEWASSSHAYAAISPMFHKFEQKITDLSQGTVGYFCMRCHSPVGVALNFPRSAPIYEAPPAAREGVTCVACHRVAEQYNRVNGDRRIEPGDEYAPIFGAGDGAGLAEVLSDPERWKVKPSPEDKGPGQPIHNGAIQFEQLNRADFCVSCHQVAVHPGIKLEVVWDQYRASPARHLGITCQDCHMGRSPGKASGYATGPAAIVNGRPTDPHRKHSNHNFYGPGYSIAHPGVFPWRAKDDNWTIEEWLQFDWRSAWGTEDFEDAVFDEKIRVDFPPAWKESDDRLDAREIIDANLKRLQKKDAVRKMVMENGSRVDGPFFAKGHPPRIGFPLDFYYVVENTDLGHNLPTGSLGAQPQLWLNVVLTDPSGRRVWESGYVDSYGDLADLHSEDVLNGRLPHDNQLFNLQTKFLTTNVKGTDREMPLPINFDVDQLPFLRPGAQPISVINHPPLIRMEAHSLPPTAHKKARYRVPERCLTQPGRYTLSVRMRSRLEPIYFMRFCEATPEMARSMNERILDFHAYSTTFEVFGTGVEAAFYAPVPGRSTPASPAPLETLPERPPAAEELPSPEATARGGSLFSPPQSR